MQEDPEGNLEQARTVMLPITEKTIVFYETSSDVQDKYIMALADALATSNVVLSFAQELKVRILIN